MGLSNCGRESLPKPLRKEGMCQRDYRWELQGLKQTPTLIGREASPPSPLRMERGVNTIVCKWIGRFFDARRGSSRHKETPFSNREGRFFNSRILSPLFLFSITLQANSSHHSPLHSERGWGWGCRWLGVRLVVYGGEASLPFLLRNNFLDHSDEFLLT